MNPAILLAGISVPGAAVMGTLAQVCGTDVLRASVNGLRRLGRSRGSIVPAAAVSVRTKHYKRVVERDTY